MILAYVQNFLILYLIIKILLHVVPKSVFAKYVAFFAGVVLVIGIMQPVLSGFGTEDMKEKFEYEEWESILLGLSEDAIQLEGEAAEMLGKYKEEKQTHTESEIIIENIEVDIDGQAGTRNDE